MSVLLLVLSATACIGGPEINENNTFFAGVTYSDTNFVPEPDTFEVPSTDLSCDELRAAWFDAADALNTCNGGGQCQALGAPVCNAGLGCGGVLVSRFGNTAELDVLAAQYADKQCPTDETCDCGAAAVLDTGCQDGRCTACTYVCDLDCTCSVDASGCDIAECAPPGPPNPAACEAITQQIDQIVGAFSSCNTNADCQVFEAGQCETPGCFARGIRADADLEALQLLGLEAQARECPDFRCGCDPSEGTSCQCVTASAVCLDGQCRSCPGDCTGSCDALQDAIVAEADELNECQYSTECYAYDTGLCDLPDLGCGYTPVVTGVETAAQESALLFYLTDTYKSQGCAAPGDCECSPTPTTFACLGGVCTTGGDCNQLQSGIDALSTRDDTTNCTTDTDCVLVQANRAPYCGADGACQCWTPMNNAGAYEYEQLIDAFALPAGCLEGAAPCPCDSEICPESLTTVCTDGQCVLGQ